MAGLLGGGKRAELGMAPETPMGGIDIPAAGSATGVDPYDVQSAGNPTVQVGNPFAGSSAGGVVSPSGAAPTGGVPAGSSPYVSGRGFAPGGVGGGISSPSFGGAPMGSPGLGFGPNIGFSPGGQRGLDDPTFGLGHILDIIAKQKQGSKGGFLGGLSTGLGTGLPALRQNIPYGWLNRPGTSGAQR